ncbi:MAG TPA: hypothetical protein PKN23_00235 [Candidatus Hydrogenedentes bacterium]|nr:hypothetical protein [Candidatus Hydrogenedentota bacterium]
MNTARWMLAAAFLLPGAAFAEHADYVYLPPAKAGADLSDAGRTPLPRTVVQDLVAAARPVRTVTAFEGKNAALKAAAAEKGAFRVAEGVALGLDAHELFGAGRRDGETTRFVAGIASAGALAVRLRVDVGGFGPGQALYVTGAAGGRVHGPFTAADADVHGLWLPTVSGAEAVLVLESPDGALPPLHVEAVSHFFTFFTEKAEKADPCPLPADCETDPAAWQVSTGEGILIIAVGLAQAQCSGTLLNRAGTPDFKPLFITAHHCFEGAFVRPAGVDVFWDYRTGVCDPGGAAPKVDELPRSGCEAFLAETGVHDGQLLLLDGAPVGAYGRAWAGWDSADPAPGDAVKGFHYPAGTPLKTCRGVVLDPDHDECTDLLCTTRYEGQIRVNWLEGITEGGSSGSALLNQSNQYRLAGMLSNGTVHSCGRPERNFDNYGSFPRFFPYIACHLVEGAECQPSGGGCFLSRIFGASGSTASRLRAFRDQVLASSPGGRKAVDAYYAVSPGLVRVLDALESAGAVAP